MNRTAPSPIARKGAEVARTKYVVVEEVRVIVKMPATTTDRQANAVVRTLASRDVQARLRGAIRGVLAAFPALAGSRISLDR